MHCYYINLEHAADRRAALEANFNRCRRSGWVLERFNAVNESDARQSQLPGSRSWREKACFLSHKGAIEMNAADGKSIMVLEDDAELGLSSLEIIDGIIEENAGTEWDLLFTDVAVVNIGNMMSLAMGRDQLLANKKVLPLDLAKIPFFGATAYVVNGASKPKLLAYLAAGIPVDTEYDIYLWNGIAQGTLKAAVLFPFVTTLSNHASITQIQPSHMATANLARDTFRRMMWLESTPESYSAELEHLAKRLEGTLCGKIAVLAGAAFIGD